MLTRVSLNPPPRLAPAVRRVLEYLVAVGLAIFISYWIVAGLGR